MEQEDKEEVELEKDINSKVMAMKQEDFIISSFENMAGHRVRRMKNLGNTCYFNSVLQNLLSIDRLRVSLQICSPKLDCADRPITRNLWSLFLNADTTNDAFDQLYLTSLLDSIRSIAPEFRGNQQQDSHEFLRRFLNGLQEEENGWVKDIFEGSLSSTVTCDHCGHISRKIEPFLDLSLSLPSTESDGVVRSKEHVFPAREVGDQDDQITSGFFEYRNTGPRSFILRKRKTCSVLAMDNMDLNVHDGDANKGYNEYQKDICGKRPSEFNRDSGEGVELVESHQKKVEDLGEVEDPEEGDDPEEEVEDPEDCCGHHPCICNKHIAAALPECRQNDQIKEKDEDPETEEEEDAEDCCGHYPCICNKDSGETAALPESQRTGQIKEDPEDCCGNHPCICKKDLGEIAAAPEKDKDPDAEEEEDPENCCGHHPCTCNKDSGKIAAVTEKDEDPDIEEEEDPEDCCGHHPCICNKDSGEIATAPENLQKDQIKEEKDEDMEAEEEEDPEDCCGHHPCICNKDSVEIAALPEGQQKDQTKEDKEEADPEEPNGCCEKQVLVSNEEDLQENQGNLTVEEFTFAFEEAWKNDNLDFYRAVLSGPEVSNVQDEGESLIRKRRCKDLEPILDFTDGMQSADTNGNNLTIERCLELFTEPEPVEYTCEHCPNRFQPPYEGRGKRKGKGKGKLKPETSDSNRRLEMGGKRTLLLARIPPILTIHLKRFKQDAHGTILKIDNHIKFKEMLDLTPYVDPSYKDKELRYRLIGVVEHLGTFSAGHYVAYVKGVLREGNCPVWLKANDNSPVREVLPKEVLKSMAYILFFETMQD
ncbi:ubiquitin carboxyl-terminal hydrolase 16-like [Asparagus officinalis]|uniref:ubiquitin carboxyl-terminal hydrolase 16-like n=1 Tax=Asparagus officinalis TaxID=4686 RepID=UPI00098E4F77|nr:ubiquitin carboxyl-terminal hydrolase 16-like [Asparagus officinalis]